MALNNTSKIIGLPDIAQIIETDLNTLSTSLYNDSEISSEIIFNITADTQEYHVMTTTENTAGDDIYYTPGILEKLVFAINPNPNMSMYNEVYSLRLYGYFDEMEDVRIIYDKYIMDQKGAYITYNSWLIKKDVQGIDFAAPIDPNDGTGKDRFLSVSTMRYDFLDGGIHATNTTFEIDEVEVPLYSLTINREKQVKGAPYSDNDTLESRPNTQSLAIGIAFPLLTSNAKMIALAQDIADENYMTNTYDITYDDGILELDYTMYLSGGSYEAQQDGIVVIKATFNVYRDGGI